MSNQPKKNLLLMDINSHLSRAYHSALTQELHKLEGAYYEGKPRYMIPQALNFVRAPLQEAEGHQPLRERSTRLGNSRGF